MSEEYSAARRAAVEAGRQIVVKAGTRLLTDPVRMKSLISGIAGLRRRGHRVLLVSSGAVGTGMGIMKLSRRPREVARVQALAAIGQSKLMAMYDAECRKFGFSTAQLLLTQADFRSRQRYLHLSNCIRELEKMDVLPIINENDSVSVSEIKFGDNDTLAASLAAMTGSGLTVILTTESGLRERNPDGSLGARLPVVAKLKPEMYSLARGTDNSDMSIGGMTSKLKAAGVVTAAGGYLWIADGREEGILEKIADGADVGTLFLPGPGRLRARKCWIKFFAKANGTIFVDDGAADAVVARGKSLLPGGMTGFDGKFRRGDTVEIRTADNRIIGRGLTNYSRGECELIRGLKVREAASVLGADCDEEVIHRDNLVLE